MRPPISKRLQGEDLEMYYQIEQQAENEHHLHAMPMMRQTRVTHCMAQEVPEAAYDFGVVGPFDKSAEPERARGIAGTGPEQLRLRTIQKTRHNNAYDFEWLKEWLHVCVFRRRLVSVALPQQEGEAGFE